MFAVKKITASSFTLKDYYQNLLAQVNWRPGVEDIDCYISLDPEGLYVAEVDDKPVGVGSLIKYENGYFHAGSFIVEKAYRSHGYGVKFTQALMGKYFSQLKVGSLYAVPEMEEKYKIFFGGERQWTVGRYDFKISKAVKILQQNTTSLFFDAKPMSSIDVQALYNYDKSVFGYSREEFLDKWCKGPGRYARVAFNKQGHVVGYVVVRRAFIKNEGYKIGPLFCNSIEVAKVLLKEVFGEIIDDDPSSSLSVHIDSPTERNAEAKDLIELLEGKCTMQLVFMTLNGLPKGRFENWFAVTTAECG